MDGGARHLARIHGTEEDRQNCPFYFKVGSCRHVDRCQRSHDKPLFSTCVLIPHMWNNPLAANGGVRKTPKENDEDFQQFFEDVFAEADKFGEIEDFVVCENLGDHLLGHLFIKYYDEEDAQACVEAMRGRFFDGKELQPEFSPVCDFREARCRQFDTNNCARGLMCNFMHTRQLPGHTEYLVKLLKSQPKRGDRSKHFPVAPPSSTLTGAGGGGSARGPPQQSKRGRSRDRRR